ncbi:restriction endonuclease subunit S [Streptomyces sp. NBC_00663]|uniref:restriction endonuclease subunit S n=1 Tax=Streptomyces sp. NBC_00663 TaxID=2975801 RepID=UPI002E32E9D8|nr:restriction endonuclease subunit S [Streptomyces sp. NBC_00663]
MSAGAALPPSWSRARVGSVGTVVTGSTPSTGDRSNYGHEFLFVSPGDLGRTKYVTASGKMLSARGFSRSRRVPAGSTLFVCIGSTIGKVGLAGRALATNQQINAVVPAGQVDPEFLYYAVSALSPLVRERAGEQAVPLVNKTEFAAFEIALPSLPEQRLIAESLSDVDALMSVIERMLAKKQAIKLGMTQHLLTNSTRPAGRTDPQADVRLGEISASITKGATPTTYGFAWESSGIPFLRSECVSERGLDMRQSMFISPAAHHALRRSRIADGDILMTITGYVGRVVRLVNTGEANINQHIARVRIKDGRFDPGYVYHYLSQHAMREYYESIVTGQAYPQISLAQVRNTGVPALPHDEQRAIAAALDDADGELTVLRRRLTKAQQVKQGMMRQLLTGRTRLPAQENAVTAV